MARTIGDRVKEALDAGLIAASDLAREANVNYGVIVNLKRRPGSSTSAERAARISEILDRVEGLSGLPTITPRDIRVPMPDDAAPTRGMSEEAAFSHATSSPDKPNDVRVQLVDGRMVVQADVNKSGIDALRQLIDVWEKHMD